MTERGVFVVDRGIWDHPTFRSQPFTDREAFMWLIGEAAFRPRRARIGSTEVELARGQLTHSLRFMASKWRWSEAAVRRFLARLKTDAIIDADTDVRMTRITICNYDRYQFGSSGAAASTGAVIDARPTQDRRKVEEGNNTIPIGMDALASRTSPPAGLPAATDWPTRLWADGVKIVTDLTGRPEPSVRGLIGKWRKQAKDDCRMVLRVLEDARDHNPADPVSWIEGALKNRGKPPSGDIMSMVMARH